MEKLTRFSVKYPVSVMMLILAVILLGLISFGKLGVDLFPDLNNPRLFVEIQAGERPPEEIEQNFVENIESLAIRQKNVTNVSSVSRVGDALVTVEYSWDADMDEAFLDLQKAVTSFSQNVEVDDISISQHNPNATPIITLTLSHPDINDMDELRQVAENYLRNELVRLEGIAEVELIGEEEREVVVHTDAYLMKAYNVTPSQISSQIASYNRNVSGGSIEEMGQKYVIKGVSEFKDIKDIGNIILTYKQAQDLSGEPIPGEKTPVFLDDVAEIEFRNKEPQNIAYLDQKRCLAIAVYKETAYNTVKAVENFYDEFDNIRRALPAFDLQIIQNQADFIQTAIDEVEQTALIGILLAVAVLFVFLRRIGTTFIISLAIPISIIATFNLMYFNGLTLNIMTLGGLALGAGMLVDNAIVVMENIYRHLESGATLEHSAIQGTAQVGGAITASTITTIVVFLPIVYLHGSAGELFKDQAWTVAFSLFSSLVVAILVIPMLSHKILKPVKTDFPKSIQFPWYPSFLKKVLQHPWRVMLGGAVLIALAVVSIPFIGSEFVPQTKSNQVSLRVNLPPGTDLYRTERTVLDVEKRLQQTLGDNVQHVFSIVGPTSLLTGEKDVFEDENTAVMRLLLNPKRTLKEPELFNRLNLALADIRDAEFQFERSQSSLQTILDTDKAPISVEIHGEELSVIQQLTEQVKTLLQNNDDLMNVESSFDEGREEVNVVVDRVRAGLLGVDIAAVNDALQNHLSGVQTGQWRYKGEMQDITLKLPKMSVSELGNIEIFSSSQRIRLDDIADIELTRAPSEIHRRNQVRTGLVSAGLQTDKPFDHVIRAIDNQLATINFPTDYRYEITGEEKKRQEAFANLQFALLLSIILVYMVLASQFESLVHPFTILLTIPLALVGSVFIFLIIGEPLNIMAVIGMIMLVGIAVNDSIILVDAINQIKRDGASTSEAIVQAGQRRIRPIIMTSLTTILALLPLTFGFGEGAALRAPMAFAVIGGLVTSTLLTLVLIPAVYMQMDRIGKKNPVVTSAGE